MKMISQTRYVFNPHYLLNLLNLTPFNIFSSKLISSIYIPCVEKNYCAKDIARVFYCSGIARLSKISIERNGKYNCVYALIDSWLDTEPAYNFISRLRNPQVETRIIHDQTDELWWPVQINKYPHKLNGFPKKGMVITLFTPLAFEQKEENFEDDTEEFRWNELYNNNRWKNPEMTYEQFVEEENAWVDLLLEKMESDERYRYEQPSLEYDNRRFY